MTFLCLVTFKLVRASSARDQTRLRCEFVTNPFSDSRDISYTNKQEKSQTAPKTEPCAVQYKLKPRLVAFYAPPASKRSRLILTVLEPARSHQALKCKKRRLNPDMTEPTAYDNRR